MMIGSVVAVQAQSMIERYQFDKSVEQLIDQLNATKQLALTSGNDLVLKLKQAEKKLYCVRFSPINPTARDHFYTAFSLKAISDLCLGTEKKNRI